jgi:hypothetical protein
VRRRVWWQLVHCDVVQASASGLTPILEKVNWDVEEISELKDEYIGTQAGRDYEAAVAAGTREKDMADDPRAATATSMVSTGSILALGKFRRSSRSPLIQPENQPWVATDGHQWL